MMEKLRRNTLLQRSALAAAAVFALNAGLPIKKAFGIELSESSCDGLSSDQTRNPGNAEKLKSCCDRVFRDAGPASQKFLDLGDTRYSAAGKGRLLCIDQFAAPESPVKPRQLVRRNVITGPNTKLRDVRSLEFSQVGGRPQLFVADSDKGIHQVLAFNYRFDGNVFPDREWHDRDLPSVLWMTAEDASGLMTLLGSDGRILRISLAANDLSLKKEDHARIEQSLSPDPALKSPVAIAVSAKLGSILVLSEDGTVHLFSSQGSGRVQEEGHFASEGLRSHVRLSVSESKSEVTVTVYDREGASFKASYPLESRKP